MADKTDDSGAGDPPAEGIPATPEGEALNPDELAALAEADLDGLDANELKAALADIKATLSEVKEWQTKQKAPKVSAAELAELKSLRAELTAALQAVKQTTSQPPPNNPPKGDENPAPTRGRRAPRAEGRKPRVWM